MTLIKKPHELEAPQSIKVLLYGQPGIGKSTAGVSAPAPLLIDCDGGVHRIKPEHQCDTVQVRSWEDIGEVLAENISAYQTIVIDTVGKMLDFMSASIIAGDARMGRKDGQLTLQGYGVRKGMFQRFVGYISTMGKNLVFVAHDKEEKNGDDKIIRPEIGGSSAGDLIKELDLVGYMEARGKNRTISFNPCEKFYGKNTCGLPEIMTLPDLLKVEQNTFLVDVFAQNQEAAKRRAEMMGEYTELISEIDGKISEVKDAESANDFMKYAQENKHIWGSKLYASKTLRDKAESINLSFNKKTKQYEAKDAG